MVPLAHAGCFSPPPLVSLLTLRCENLWDPLDAHTCTIWKFGEVNIPWGKAFTSEIQKLRGTSSPSFEWIVLGCSTLAILLEDSFRKSSNQFTYYKGVASLEMYPWTDLLVIFHLSSIPLPLTSAFWNCTSWKHNGIWAFASSSRFWSTQV